MVRYHPVTQLGAENGQCHRMALLEDYGWQNYHQITQLGDHKWRQNMT